MAEEKKTEQETNLSEESKEEKKEKSLDELIAEAVDKKMADREKQHRAEVVGRDNKIRELTDANEELKKAQMKAEEREKYDKEQYDAKMAQREQDVAAKELALEKANIAMEMGVPKELVPRLAGETAEELRADAKALMEAYGASIQEGINKKLAESGGKPSAGDGKPSTTITREQAQDPAFVAGVYAMPPGPERDALETRLVELSMGAE